jgi:hypothetical protein
MHFSYVNKISLSYKFSADSKFRELVNNIKSLLFVPDCYVNNEVEKLKQSMIYFKDFNISNFFSTFIKTYSKTESCLIFKKCIYDGESRLRLDIPLTSNIA